MVYGAHHRAGQLGEIGPPQPVVVVLKRRCQKNMALGWVVDGERRHDGRQGELVLHRNGVDASVGLNKGPRGLNEAPKGLNEEPKGLNEGAEGRNIGSKRRHVRPKGLNKGLKGLNEGPKWWNVGPTWLNERPKGPSDAPALVRHPFQWCGFCTSC